MLRTGFWLGPPAEGGMGVAGRAGAEPAGGRGDLPAALAGPCVCGRVHPVGQAPLTSPDPAGYPDEDAAAVARAGLGYQAHVSPPPVLRGSQLRLRRFWLAV